MRNTDGDIYKIFIIDLNLADTHHVEWDSGFNVIYEIKKECKDPIILVYSQFLNPDFKMLKSDGTLDENVINGRYSEIVGSYRKDKFELSAENLIPKSIAKYSYSSKEKPVELNDLDLLILKLANIVFNNH